MPQKKHVSQISILIMLVMSCLMLCVPAAALTGWIYVDVPDALTGSLRIRVPTGLKSDFESAAGLLILGTNEEILDLNNTDALGPDQWLLVLGVFPMELTDALAPVNQKMTLVMLVDIFREQIVATVKDATLGDSTFSTIDDYPSARIEGTSSQGDVVVTLIQLEDGYLVSTAAAATGEMSQLEPLFLSIFESAEYTP